MALGRVHSPIILPAAVTTYQWLLFLHVLAAFALMAMSLTVHVLYLASRPRRRRPSEVLRLLGVVRVVGPMIGPIGLVTLAFGIWLVLEVGYEWGAAWIVASLVLFAMGTVAGPILKRSLAPVGMLAARLVSEGDQQSDELYRALNSPRVLLVVGILSLSPYVILVLMVFRP
jgi:uncharacterized membrane protein